MRQWLWTILPSVYFAYFRDFRSESNPFLERCPVKYTDDANHVAVAVANGIGYFCSWNFKHLVKVNIRREVNLINAMTGYGPIEIIAPPEL